MLKVFNLVKHRCDVYSPVLLLLAGDVLEVEPVQTLLRLYHTHVQAVPPEYEIAVFKILATILFPPHHILLFLMFILDRLTWKRILDRPVSEV